MEKGRGCSALTGIWLSTENNRSGPKPSKRLVSQARCFAGDRREFSSGCCSLKMPFSGGCPAGLEVPWCLRLVCFSLCRSRGQLQRWRWLCQLQRDPGRRNRRRPEPGSRHGQWGARLLPRGRLQILLHHHDLVQQEKLQEVTTGTEISGTRYMGGGKPEKEKFCCLL